MLNSFSHVRLCNRMNYSPSGSSVHGILQARTLEWVAMPSPKGPSPPTDRTCVSCSSCLAGRSFATELLGSPLCIMHSYKTTEWTLRLWWGSRAALPDNSQMTEEMKDLPVRYRLLLAWRTFCSKSGRRLLSGSALPIYSARWSLK